MDMAAAIISAGAAILVCLLNNFYMDKRREAKAETDFEVLKASITAEIRSLTKEVEKHNQVVERVYSLETKADVFEEKMKVANQRIDDLEKKAV